MFVGLSPGIPSQMSVDYAAFEKEPQTPSRCFHCLGTLLNTNTIDKFKNCDKKDLLTNIGGQLWKDITSGDAISNPTLLSRFLILTYADLKKYRYYYWFAFPCLCSPSDVTMLTDPKALNSRFNAVQLDSFLNSYDNFQLGGLRYQSYFVICEDGESVSVTNLSDLKQCFQNHKKVLLGFADPCSLAGNPGWPLRNLLTLFAYHWAKIQNKVEVVCFRDRTKDGVREISHSIVLTLDISSTNSIEECPQCIGWEKNERQKMGPRMVNLSASMDPKRLAESAVSLNLKLMRWRLLPELDLDKISRTKCLLLGAGTLGCNVARCLMGWGVKTITLVDNGKISYSNPVRQSLYVFDDCMQGGKPKAETAAKALEKIYPGIVFMVDPIKEEGRELLKVAEAFNVHSAPIRIGVVFVVDFNPELTGEMDAGIALVRAFEYIKQEEDESKALSFITDVYEKGEDLVAIFGADSEYDSMRKSAHDFISQSGLSDFPQVLMNGIPLKKESLTMENFEEGVVAAILQATPVIQKAAYDGSLHDNIVVLDWLMEKDNVMPRLNSRVLSPTISTLDFTENTDEMIFEDVDTFRMMSSKDMTSILSQNMKYLTRKDEETVRAVTMWIVCDLETPIGRDLLYSALKNLKSSHELRLGVLFNPSDVEDSFISTAIYVALTTLENQLARSLITKLVKEENVADLKSRAKTIADLEVHGMDMEAYVQALKEQTTDFLTVHSTFVRKVLKFPAGRRGIVTNGKVIGPFEESEEFNQQDIELQEKYIYQQSAKRIREQIKKLGIVGDQGSDLLMKVAALLTSKTTADSRKDLHYHANVHSAVKIPSESSSPAFQIEAILDPLSTDAQKMAPMLMVLKEVANVDITIFMNSRSKLSDMPLKNFYRYVLEPTLQFKADGSLTAGPLAKFVDLPHKSLLTLGMNPPESWLVEAVRSPYDLDNILLEEVEYGVTGEFDLEYILLEGHCHDATTGQPPRGLQFTLSAKNNPVVMDTIVMANLGYFQLKTNPGVWHLQMREGRSSEIYSISGHEYTDTPEGADDIVVTIGNFKSKTIRVKVNKKTGMEDEDLLADEEEDDSTGLWGSLSSTLTGSVKEDDKDATLNIFSLASGHLYERLLRIMMLSVLKQTKMKVKFWFLKNYLSPTFKDFIPHMAENYGFQYELVQYKWPRWLTQQKEKQRIIWGYKILFLDVLFPLDVKKIIFVDADQIVRTDLQELNDFDLQGAPYGYTPFCSDRKEMDGFRFWKSGYWASHLAGRKYHISALYVVDLKKFRRIAAGDRLRGQYQGLSQDPNSLSNLDQDLPNNMIHQVKIKSLPQEWLWCETWCSDQSKAAAKTIDLCNNPLTKEPKLQAAMRIVPEWKNYDYEIKVLWDEIYGTNTQSQIEYEPPVLDNISDKKKEEL
ncbi:hypothetical protein ScPMuIL_018364 [Solemya velum]